MSIHTATRALVEELGRTMRPEDAAEVLASSGLPPEEAAATSAALSEECYAVCFNGQVAFLFGVGGTERPTLLSEPAGVVWALTSHAVTRHKKTFLRETRWLLASLLARYAVLYNYVDARYAAALRWAEVLGFAIGEPEPFGVAGLPFHPIAIRRPTCAK